MQGTSLPPRDENMMDAGVTIRRPVTEVFRFYRDFRNLPSFQGDVIAVEQIDPTTSRWTIQGPLGTRANWTVRVIEEHANALIRYETVTSPRLRTYWEMHFGPAVKDGETDVHEVMKIPFGRLGRAALALIGKFPAQEMASNLHRLKELLETGKITDTSYSVAGRFAQQPYENGC